MCVLSPCASLFREPLLPRSPRLLQPTSRDKGTIEGARDSHKQEQLDFWNEYALHGTTDERARSAAHRFKRSFEALEERLAQHAYLMGQTLTLADIAWFIYANRLSSAGYPFARLHPRVDAWYQGLMARPDFSREVAVPAPLRLLTAALQAGQALRGQTLSKVAGF